MPTTDPVRSKYNKSGFQYVPMVKKDNSNYKTIVSEFIYEYVESIVGDQIAPIITATLVDLPIEEIKAYLYDFETLKAKITDAVTLLGQNQNIPEAKTQDDQWIHITFSDFSPY